MYTVSSLCICLFVESEQREKEREVKTTGGNGGLQKGGQGKPFDAVRFDAIVRGEDFRGELLKNAVDLLGLPRQSKLLQDHS